jgi:hypothetical protein
MNRKSRWLDWVLRESAQMDTPLPWASGRARILRRAG